MKPHRQIRSSKRVGSDNGVAFDAMFTDNPESTPYQQKREQIVSILRTLPIIERHSMVSDLVKMVTRGELI